MNRQHLLLLACLCVLLSFQPLTGQQFSGLGMDNYGGVQSILLNPANAASSRTAFELHIGTVSAALTSDYATIDGSMLQEAIEAEDPEIAILERMNAGAHNGFAGVDVVGPSLMIAMSERTSIGITTRVRGMYSAENVNGYLFEATEFEFPPTGSFDFEQTDYRSSTHLWGELAFTLGTTVVKLPQHRLGVGAAVKRLQGLGAVYTYGSRLTGAYDDGTERMNFEGDVTFGRTSNFYLDDLDLQQRTSGFGFDLGVAYEYHPGGSIDDGAAEPYRLKLGAVLADIGSIDYEATEETAYDVDGSLPGSRVEDAGGVEFLLAENFDGRASRETVGVRLPTTLRLMADLHLTGGLFVGALYATTFGAATDGPGTQVPTTLNIVPRLEARWLGLYLPVSLRSGQASQIGAGLRFGIVNVGSSTLLSHMLGGEGTEAVDAFVGLRLPFYRLSERQKERKAAAAAN